MWFVLTIVVVFIIFKFNKPIDKTIGVAENLVDAATDSVETYGMEINIANAKKREEQMERVEKIEKIVSVEDIRKKLKLKETTSDS